MMTPPCSFTRLRPLEPSGPVPDRTIDTARAPCVSASVRKKMSTGDRRSSTCLVSDTVRCPSAMRRLVFGEITYT